MCDGSLITEIEVVKILESYYPEVVVIENSCFCEIWARRPYATMKGKRIFAKTTKECLSLIRHQIEVELAVYA
ncbi:DUF1450 domain-containing protein [Niallia nealsonii]|uniref:DUF1450 domain-containing protein n=1 Tax=Niallia nealsonii TaxID=115979 RepID=UPI001F4209C1|nr:DUF1450 domain-containing protein [Niallia nealsonii]